ncbi:MAG: glycerophosphodiester phosphodiesterase [Chloroflexota bacterium]
MIDGGPPRRLAHRGDHRAAQENSVAAIEAAARVRGCDGIEFDVRTSRDGVPVLNHDPTLARVHDRPERVDQLTAAQLSEIGVPTLSAALAVVPHDAFLDIELKEEPTPSFVPIVAAARGRELTSAVVSSFDPYVLVRMSRLAPSWPRWLNTHDLDERTVAQAAELGCQAIAAEYHAITRDSVRAVRARGIDVVAWTVVKASTFRRLVRLGITAACVEGTALEDA